jgi:glycosyltransferase involved in cell wall biosynthesis
MLTPISIVVPIKNRTYFTVKHENKDITLKLFQKNIESLISLYRPEDTWEILVIDFGSSDVSMELWLESLGTPFSLRYIHVDGPFSRGKALNIGFDNSSHPILLALDADMEIRTRDFFTDIEEYVGKQQKAFFPICWSYTNPEHNDGYKRDSGKGICALQKIMVQRYIENKIWGKEDDINYEHFEKQNKVIRPFYDEMYIHQWHPEEFEFKNKYYEKKNDSMMEKKNKRIEDSIQKFQERKTNGTRASLLLRK